MATYRFEAKIWKYKGPAAWYFVTLPHELSKKIRKKHGSSEEGWGRLKVKATMRRSTWQTAIWHDSKAGAYLLPIKSAIRKKEAVERDETLRITLMLAKEVGEAY